MDVYPKSTIIILLNRLGKWLRAFPCCFCFSCSKILMSQLKVFVRKHCYVRPPSVLLVILKKLMYVLNGRVYTWTIP